MDATTIKVCLSLFPWASFRQRKGGVKMHALLDHDGYIPAFAAITDARTHESRVAKVLELPPVSIPVLQSWIGLYSITQGTKQPKPRVI